MNLNNIDQLLILLADDDPDDREFFSEAISELEINNKIVVFNGGKDLIDYLESAEKTPDLLFLDLNMPCKTGIDCLTEIRENPLFNTMRIAIYSTSSSEKDIEKSFRKGADIYIKKPNEFNKLKKIIQDFVKSNWMNKASGQDTEFCLFRT